MTTQDWILILALFLLVAYVAYTVGSRSGQPPGKSSPSPSPSAGAEPKAIEAKPAPAPAAAALEEAAVAPAASESGLARLDYEEDAEIDPTKIGGGPAPKRAVYQPPVQRIIYDDDAEEDEPTKTESLFLVSATAQTDTGLRRKRNEDSLLVLESAGVFVVADGMGGYRGGETASQLAVTTIGDAFRRRTFEGVPHDGIPTQASELARAIQMGNSAILEIAKQRPELQGMGTTVCAARFSANKKRVYIGHVGDSRCYRLREGVLHQLTADHTMADHGVTGPEAAHLSRAVGIWPTVPIDIIMAVPLAGDVYLICSDGLTKMLNDTILANVLREEEDLNAAVARLILFANSRGGKDNITVVLIRVVPPDWRPKPSEPFHDAVAAESHAAIKGASETTTEAAGGTPSGAGPKATPD